MDRLTRITREELITRLGWPERTVELYLSDYKKNQPSKYALYVTKGPKPIRDANGSVTGYGRRATLYDPDLVEIFRELRDKSKTLEDIVVQEKVKVSPVRPTKDPEVLIPEVFDSKGNNTAKPVNFYKDPSVLTDQEWDAIYLMLEATCTLREVSAYYRLDPDKLATAVQDKLGIDFATLRNIMDNAGRAKIKLTIMASTIGTKTKPANPLMQMVQMKARLGIDETNKSNNPENVVFVDGNEVVLDDMNKDDLIALRDKLKEIE